MVSSTLHLAELNSLTDPLLLPWLKLYETAFPATERMLIATHLQVIAARGEGQHHESVYLAATDEAGEFVGLAQYEVMDEARAACLWYFAVVPERRCQGLGAAIYQEVARRLGSLELQAMLIEVERPDHAASPEGAELAQRRIGFYRRQGARLLRGIHYLQSVGPHQPPIPMHLMVHPFAPLDPADAFAVAKVVFGEDLTQTGSLALD